MADRLSVSGACCRSYLRARDLLEREWAGIECFGDYLLGFDAAELAPHCLGDHGSLIAQGFSSGSPDKEFVGWCAILWALGLVFEAGERLGCDVERFAAAAAELRPRIIDRFKHENGSFGDGTDVLAFAAELGLGDRSELVGALVRAIKAEGCVLTTGIFGTSFAFRLLAEYGYSELLERWLLREENPSLLGMLADGNGALIEMFDDPLASCDHAMFSSYDQWFYEAWVAFWLRVTRRAATSSRSSPTFRTLRTVLPVRGRPARARCAWSGSARTARSRLPSRCPRASRRPSSPPGARRSSRQRQRACVPSWSFLKRKGAAR